MEDNKDIEKTKDVEQTEQEVSVQDAYDELNKKYLYLNADFDNYRKNMNIKMSNLRNEITADVAIKFIDVADSFDLALTHIDNPKEAEGIELIYKKFNDILKSFNIETIVVNEGDTFDENIHDAISVMEGPLDNTIKYVLKKGYQMGDKVIRHTQVIVSKTN